MAKSCKEHDPAANVDAPDKPVHIPAPEAVVMRAGMDRSALASKKLLSRARWVSHLPLDPIMRRRQLSGDKTTGEGYIKSLTPVGTTRTLVKMTTTARLVNRQSVHTVTRLLRSTLKMGSSCSTTGSRGETAASRTTSSSLSAVLSTLAPAAVYALVWLLLFLLLRNRFPRYYRPRTFVESIGAEHRTPDSKAGWFAWIFELWALPESFILKHHSIDGYFFLRFIKVAITCCIAGCLVTWPILFPINVTGGGGKSQLDILTLANVRDNYYKCFAHTGCAILFFTFILYMITRESIYYIRLRQVLLMSPVYSERISARTVLYTSVPKEYTDENKLRRMLGPGVRRVWISTNCSELERMVKSRDNTAVQLEAAETKLVKKANAKRLKAERNAGRVATSLALTPSHSAGYFVAPGDRPTHRSMSSRGKKVDTIEWCREELREIIPRVEAEQAKHRALQAETTKSVFVEFQTSFQASAAYQSLTHHLPLQMSARLTGMTPGEVVWANLDLSWWQRTVRRSVVVAAVAALVVFWSLPVAAIGALSNINYLICVLPWLEFIERVPDVVIGVVTGLLPTILLAILMSLLPLILRSVARMQGEPTASAIELAVQNYFFAFQVIQVFLVATLGSTASSVLQKILNKPASAAFILADNLPLASTFYLSYFVLQGFAVVSNLLLGLAGLLVLLATGKILDKTPRKMYERWMTLSGIGWGTVFPIYTNLFVIALCYAVLAPLILGFAAAGLSLFYCAYKYNLLFVSNAVFDTKGLLYPQALQHLFVGLYLAELCLIGLFAIASSADIRALGPLVLMAVFTALTAIYHLTLSRALSPLLDSLPKSLEADAVEHIESHGDVVSSPQSDKASFFGKWLNPDVFARYETMREWLLTDFPRQCDSRIEEDTFLNPAITSATPTLWIPRDPMGLSRREVDDTREIISITDDNAYLNDKNEVLWRGEQSSVHGAIPMA